jgi:hypothetical protein
MITPLRDILAPAERVVSSRRKHLAWCRQQYQAKRVCLALPGRPVVSAPALHDGFSVMKRYWRATMAVLLVLIVALVLLAPFAGSERCPCSSEALARIQGGMTQGEVEVLLGRPPGDYRTWHVAELATMPGDLPGRPAWWHWDDASILVCFDDDKVIAVWRLERTLPPWAHRLRRSLGV